VIFCNTFVVGWQAEKTPRNTTDQDRHLVERSSQKNGNPLEVTILEEDMTQF